MGGAPKGGFQRRDFLRNAVGTATLFAPGPWAYVWAQGAGGNAQLLKLPKIALVIGNSAYAQAPLKNPANDAKGMAEALNTLGYEVNVRLDANRAAMQAAVETFVKQLAERKCVGLFYFAGHGVQINWRNYLLPADANVASNEDIEKQGIDVNAFAGALGKTGNALNLIILDACRDAPFGEASRQKGLSQMDAPRSTLLAYATAPGNVASDGEGLNGLYTEHLLREIRVPEAKVEDVFKRVRLGVRRKSNGAQIPWESTSLEDDYYFHPPASLALASDSERARRFAEELKLWDGIEKQNRPEPFEDYLKRYPSGNFSELAQFRLDRILAALGEKRVVIAAQDKNPYATGIVPLNTDFRSGDTYRYAVKDLDTLVPKPSRIRTVTGFQNGQVLFNNGAIVSDIMGNPVKTSEGHVYKTVMQMVPPVFEVGRKWESRAEGTIGGADFYVESKFRILRRESISVPAGTFNAFVVEHLGSSRWYQWPGHGVSRRIMWWAPDICRLPVRSEWKSLAYGNRGMEVRANDLDELASFSQA